MKNTIIVLSMLILFGCSEQSHYMSCNGQTFYSYFNYTTSDELGAKAKTANDTENITIKKNLFGYSVNNIKCNKDNADFLECGDLNCFREYGNKFTKDLKCKDKFWNYSYFDLNAGYYSNYSFYTSKKNNDYHVVQKEMQCTKIKKALED
jgi:hypothetical protein